MPEPDAEFVTALILVGVGLAFLHADPRSATSRALALALACAGISIWANHALLGLLEAAPLPRLASLLVLPEIIAFCAGFEWVLRVRRTIPAGRLRTRFGDSVLRVAQGLVLLYGINAWRFPEMRIREFFGGLAGSAIGSPEVLTLFAAPLAIAVLLAALAMVLCLQRAPEPAERVRLVALTIAIPVIAIGLVLPRTLAPITTVIGLTVLLAGALRHADLRGRQGQFMSRFLSPQVAALVNASGLHSTIRDERRDLSIVSVDLRGFTAFAAAQAPAAVIDLLHDYYEAVGNAAEAYGATIKDYAGDGVMILVGAPLAHAEHPARAVALAERIVREVTPIAARHAGGASLGIGAGVASGPAAVGIVGGTGPLEYAAVGAAVNLAARLAERAGPGEVLIAADTQARLDSTAVACEARPSLSLKGFAEPVDAYALTPPAA
jgi:adenylate cyclase